MADEKIPVSVFMPKSLKAKVTKLAEADERSFSNYVVRILQEHVDQAGKRK